MLNLLGGVIFAANSQATKRLDDAAAVVQQMTTGTAGIPDPVLRDAKCMAVVPGLVKGAFIVGGEHGAGVATCKVGSRWSAPAFFKISGASFGAQLGGQESDVVMMFMNQEGTDALLKGHLKVGAEVSGTAGPVGRGAEAAGGWKAGILTYSRSKGAFAGVDLNGAELHEDSGAMKNVYGKPITFEEALKGAVQPPPQASRFLSSIKSAKTHAASNR